MAKDYYNEKNYLSGDKESLETIIKLRNEYALLFAMEKLRYGDLLKMYNSFLRMVKELPDIFGALFGAPTLFINLFA